MKQATKLPILIAAVSLLAVMLAATLAATPAGAIVPPRDCKTIIVRDKPYNIKSDQLRCTLARRYAASYMRSRSKPPGYKCQRYTGSKLVFRCANTSANPDRTFFAIRK